jgi:hypothetical protein
VPVTLFGALLTYWSDHRPRGAPEARAG